MVRITQTGKYHYFQCRLSLTVSEELNIKILKIKKMI